MSDFEQDPDPDPLFHETNPRIRVHIKMKRIRNTDLEDAGRGGQGDLRPQPGGGETQEA